MLTLLVFDESTYEKVTITIITHFWMFLLIIGMRLNWVATQLPLNGKTDSEIKYFGNNDLSFLQFRPGGNNRRGRLRDSDKMRIVSFCKQKR